MKPRYKPLPPPEPLDPDYELCREYDSLRPRTLGTADSNVNVIRFLRVEAELEKKMI